MKELVTIHNSHLVNNQPTPTVSARDLHRFLEIGRDFSTWIKGRIGEYGYTENQDFVSFPQNGGKINDGRGRPSLEYHLTLDMAKELAMVEKNWAGRLVRKYFIKCEKRAMDAQAVAAELLAARPLWKMIFRYKNLGLNHAEIGRLCERKKNTIRAHVRRMEQCGLLEPPKHIDEMRKMAARMNPQLSLFGQESH